MVYERPMNDAHEKKKKKPIGKSGGGGGGRGELIGLIRGPRKEAALLAINSTILQGLNYVQFEGDANSVIDFLNVVSQVPQWIGTQHCLLGLFLLCLGAPSHLLYPFLKMLLRI
jgi:hypothetical protein